MSDCNLYVNIIYLIQIAYKECDIEDVKEIIYLWILLN